MKIAFLEPHLKIFGGIRRIIELSNRLAKQGHEVIIYHSDGSPCSWMECIAETKAVWEILQGEYDVLIFNNPARYELNLARFTKAKLKVFYCLGLYDKEIMLPGFNLEKFVHKNRDTRRTLITKRMLFNNDLLLANSSWQKKWLEENLGLEPILLLGGVNTEMFHPVAVAKDPAVIRIVYSGDPRASKGTDIIEDALRIVAGELPNVVTDTYYDKGIPQSQMAQVYSSADIFVDGQFSGGWNNPVAEALACKVPVVCTDIGGNQDFAFDEQTALLVPTQDSEAMAQAILRLARDPELRQRLSENGYQHIKTFNWDASAIRLEQLLEDGLKHVQHSYRGVRYRFGKMVDSYLVQAFFLPYYRYLGTLPQGTNPVHPLEFLPHTLRQWRTTSR